MAFGKCKTDLQQILLISANFDSPLNFHSDGSWLEMQIISTDPFDGSMDQAISDTDLPVTASNGNWQFSKLELAWNYSYQARIRVHQPDENGDDQVSDWTDWQTGQVAAQAPDPLTIAATHNSDGSTTITWDTSDTSNSNNFVSFLDEDQVWAWDAAPYSAGTYTYTPGNADGPNLQGQVTAVVVAPDPSGASVYPIGVSDYSNLITLPGDAPAGPQNLSATPYSGGVRLLWDNDSDNETGFTIQRSTSADFSTDLQTFTVAADVTSYVDNTGTDDTSVQPGTTYYYQVEANGSDETASAFSNTANAVVTLPTVSVTALDPNANADGPDGNPQDGYLDFHRTGDLTGSLAASVSYAGSTAVAGQDYSGTLPTTVTFPAGQQDVIVPVVPDGAQPEFASDVQATILDPDDYTAAPGSADVDLSGQMKVVLGDGSQNVIIQNSPDGTSNTTPLVLTFPEPADSEGSVLTLKSSQEGKVAVYDSSGNSLPWDCNKITMRPAPDESRITLAVAATGGSQNINDVDFTADDTESGTATGTATSNPGTAVVVAVENNADTVLSDRTTHNFEVGQVADFHLGVQSPFPASAITGYHWSKPGNVLYDWVEPSTPSKSGPLNTHVVYLAGNNGGVPPTGKQQPEIKFFWVSAGGGASKNVASENDTEVASVNINGAAASASAKFNVSEPVVASDFQTGPPGFGYSAAHGGDILGLPPSNLTAPIVVSASGPTTGGGQYNSGNLWSAYIDAGNVGGEMKFVQTVAPSGSFSSTATGSVPRTIPSPQVGLDTSDPYGATNPAQWPADGSEESANDTPGEPTREATGGKNDFPVFNLDYSFVTYIMYQPPGGQWVPLQEASWGYKMAGVLDPTTGDLDFWTQKPIATGTHTFTVDTAEPTWNWCWNANSLWVPPF